MGGVGDLGAVHNNNLNGIHADTTIANFLLGPRLTLIGHRSRLKPYFQVSLGGVYATISAQILGSRVDPIIPRQPITARVGASQTAFAMIAGGGLDIRITKHASFRPFEFDYYLTRLQNLPTFPDNTQSKFPFSSRPPFTFA